MLTSEFKLYSIGKVINDIKEDSLYIDVYPIEKVPNFSGGVNTTTTVNIKTSDIEGKKDNILVDKSVRIKAKWLNFGSNRITPPMVCKGETVLLFRYSNTDRFYWIPMYNEQMIRKNEKATFVFSNRKTINPKGDKLDKCYYFTIDTINKVVTLSTDASDGEYTEYKFNLDTKNGNFTIADGKGNYTSLNSKTDTWTTFTNNVINQISKNTINRKTSTLNESNVLTNITTSDSKNEDITNNYMLTLGTWNMKSKSDVSYTIGGNYNNTINGSYVISAGPMTIATPSLAISAGGASASMSGGVYDLQTDKVSISNGGAEVISIISDMCQGVIDFVGVDGDGEAVSADDPTVSFFTDLKSKIDSFKK